MKNKNSSIKIISYNLKYHRASKELEKLVSTYDPDILCIQECHARKLPDHIGDLVLGDTTPNWRLNIATYYRKDRFLYSDSSSHELKEAVLEKMFMPRMERLLVTKVFDRQSGQEVSIGSFHATSHVATNYLRRKQVRAAHNSLKEISQGGPAIMVGDYNYILFKNRLRMCLEKSGYEMSLSDRPTYYFNKYLRVRLDMAAALNTEIEKVLALPKSKLSDHAPILVHVTV